MTISRLREAAPAETPAKAAVLVPLAFFAIYVLWGSTYFAIRVLVETVPPLFAAGTRFLIAGAILYLWSRARGEKQPSRLEWRNIAIIAALMFLAAYSGLFWAEKTIPSGIASVLVATIPVWTALLQIFILKRENFRWSLIASIALGLAGVGLLALKSDAGRLSPWGCLAILGSEIAWSLGTVLSKILVLPNSKVLSAGAQMLAGGAMLLAFSALAGEMRPFPHFSLDALWALTYLIVIGSIVAFTAYVWLLGRMRPTVVSSYAYVNPVIALLIGHWLGREALGIRTAAGAALVLASVLVIARKQPAKQRLQSSAEC